MAKYSVEVNFTQRRTKTISVFAKDEDEASEKACDIVLAWDDVTDADAESVERE